MTCCRRKWRPRSWSRRRRAQRARSAGVISRRIPLAQGLLRGVYRLTADDVRDFHRVASRYPSPPAPSPKGGGGEQVWGESAFPHLVRAPCAVFPPPLGGRGAVGRGCLQNLIR